MNVVVLRQVELVKDLQDLDQREKYQAIIEYGQDLEPLPEEFRTEENEVRGCLNRVYLHSEFDGEKMRYYGMSDSLIVGGLVAILIQCYSGATPDEILNAPAKFIDEIGLNKSLTANRKNGLSAILTRIKQDALKQMLVMKP